MHHKGTRDSSEYGWLVVSRERYEYARGHGCAGPGTPMHSDRPGFWFLTCENGGTVLYTGVSIDEVSAVTLEP